MIDLWLLRLITVCGLSRVAAQGSSLQWLLPYSQLHQQGIRVPLSLHQYQHNAPLVSGREGSGVMDCYPFLKNTFLKENFFYFRIVLQKNYKDNTESSCMPPAPQNLLE